MEASFVHALPDRVQYRSVAHGVLRRDQRLGLAGDHLCEVVGF